MPEVVAIPQEVKDVWNNKGSALVLLHNHPDSLSLSPDDLAPLSHVGVSRVVAFGHDHKSTFSATRGKNIEWLAQVMEAAETEQAHQLDLLFRRSLNMDGLEAHLLNLGFERASIIRYEAKLDAKRNKVCIQEKAAIDAAAEQIAHAINRARP
ncbi:hypothetical protein FACS1894154_04750 [Betaproteobacteria bacterium]|nr:hypothetical protein FACS1894154_04750 [Betaproteobacteria bacterium]GHU26115.1 hypothetical protein FACS189488_14150 [Betaproteobacteria bacterium]GHU33000.1 hypothetical protein FACS189497_14720 [Betaproteobacteria bacterium]